jgi:hypothetical protein
MKNAVIDLPYCLNGILKKFRILMDDFLVKHFGKQVFMERVFGNILK